MSIGQYNPFANLTAGGGLTATQLQGLTLSSAGSGYPTFTVNNGTTTHANLKKYEICESTLDIMALSCAAHRAFNVSKIHYKITDRQTYDAVKEEDVKLANEIKDYYSKKVMLWKLKGNKMSSFREDMNTLIHSDGLIFKEQMIGVAYWLPVFYQYDLKLDDIKQEVDQDQKFDKMDKEGTPRSLTLDEELTPLVRLDRRTKRSKQVEYWFKSSTPHNAAVVLQVQEKNPLQGVWDYIFDKKESMKVEAKFTRERLDGFEHYSVTNLKMLKG